MSDEVYRADGSMENCLDTINNHMADGDQHINSTERDELLNPSWTNVQNKPDFLLAADFTQHIAILQGTIAHGGTIPLPEGFTQAQCKWFVSINDLDNLDTHDTSSVHHLYCSADDNRVVDCHSVSGSANVKNGIANYIIIGIK